MNMKQMSNLSVINILKISEELAMRISVPVKYFVHP